MGCEMGCERRGLWGGREGRGEGERGERRAWRPMTEEPRPTMLMVTPEVRDAMTWGVRGPGEARGVRCEAGGT